MNFEEIHDQLRKRWTGEITGIPTQINSPKFKQMLPSLDRGEKILLTGSTGGGKTTLLMRLIIDAVSYALHNYPNEDIEVLINEVEMPEMELYIKFIQRAIYLKSKGQKKYSRDRIMNRMGSTEYDAELEADFLSIKPQIDLFNRHVRIKRIDNPMQWVLYVYSILDDQYEIVSKGRSKEGRDKVVGERKNSHKHFIVAYDTLNASEEDEGLDEYQTVKRYSQLFANKILAGKYWCTIIDVQQLDVSSQKAQFSGRGERIVEKHIPSSQDLAKVKTTPQDHSIVFGMLCPHRFHIKEIEDSDGNRYDVTDFKDKLIMVYVLKSNFSAVGESVALYFDVDSLEFEEIPAPDQPTLYNEFLRKRNLGTNKKKSKLLGENIEEQVKSWSKNQ